MCWQRPLLVGPAGTCSREAIEASRAMTRGLPDRSPGRLAVVDIRRTTALNEAEQEHPGCGPEGSGSGVFTPYGFQPSRGRVPRPRPCYRRRRCGMSSTQTGIERAGVR